MQKPASADDFRPSSNPWRRSAQLPIAWCTFFLTVHDAKTPKRPYCHCESHHIRAIPSDCVRNDPTEIMACRNCRRNLLRELPSRQSLVATQSQAQSAAISRQLSRQIIAAAPQQQRRGFRSTAQSQESLLKRLGGQLLKSTSQPYQVHAATETIYKSCAAEAAYTISETDKRNGTVKKTEEGEEIGTGSTTWHTGTFLTCIPLGISMGARVQRICRRFA